MNNYKPIIYQLFPRLFTNTCGHCVPNGTIKQNGSGKMNDITLPVLKKLKDLGATHVWYTGVIRHATKTKYKGIPDCNPYIVKGNAGSPYAITDYYDIDPDIAVTVKNRMREFEQLVKRTHEAGLKVIIDFVPNHVARQYHSIAKPQGVEDLGENDNKNHAFSPNNNFYYIPDEQFAPGIDLGQGDDFYYEKPAMATGNDCFHQYPSANDWYETVKLNYGVDYATWERHFSPIPSTWHKMLDIMKFWAGKGIDGFRCDMAHMVPAEFWNWAIPQVKTINYKLIFIAELYDVAIYREYIYYGHFDYLYDKVSLYDTLRAVTCGNANASAITSCWQAVEGISEHMLNLLENHDEQRIASPQFAGDPFKALPALVVSATISRAPFMIYQGQELGEPALDAEGFSGQDGRTTIFDYWSVPTLRRWYNGGKCDTSKLTEEERKLRKFHKTLLRLCNKEKAIAQGEFYDLMYANYNSMNCDKVYAFYRHLDDEHLLIIANFGDKEENINLYTPQHALDTMHLRPGTYKAHELLTASDMTLTIDANMPVTLTIPHRNAVIIKLLKNI
ncbi:MAG: alpha-amylase [Muribaculaceae bacterium]|nr:alpha-amylase [Muribaculaceae bacterium]